MCRICRRSDSCSSCCCRRCRLSCNTADEARSSRDSVSESAIDVSTGAANRKCGALSWAARPLSVGSDAIQAALDVSLQVRKVVQYHRLGAPPACQCPRAAVWGSGRVGCLADSAVWACTIRCIAVCPSSPISRSDITSDERREGNWRIAALPRAKTWQTWRTPRGWKRLHSTLRVYGTYTLC